jgi:hypothetical protein
MSILVDKNSIKGHLDHGDRIGKCSNGNRIGFDPNTPTTSTENLKVNVAPNPSTSNFRLSVVSESTGPITIKISDAYGRVKATITGVQNNQVVTFGENYIPGTYFTEVVQGNKQKTVMLIKL